jgi:hypothetical protein
MALLEDQLEEARQAFKNAHESNDTEAAGSLAQRVFELEAKKAELDKAQTESSQAGTNLHNPLIAGGVGAVAGAAVNPVLNAVRDIAAPPKISLPHPSQISTWSPPKFTPQGMPVDPNVPRDVYHWMSGNPETGSTGQHSDVPVRGRNQLEAEKLAQEFHSKNAARADFEAKNPGRSILDNGLEVSKADYDYAEGMKKKNQDAALLEHRIQENAAKSAAAKQAESAGRFNILPGPHQPTTPFSIVKGGAKGAITGAAASDIPQQLSQGNYGTAAADTGIAGGNILSSLGKTPRTKAIGKLIGIGSGILRGAQGVNELTGAPEQKAEGGLAHLAGGGQPESKFKKITKHIPMPQTGSLALNLALGAPEIGEYHQDLQNNLQRGNYGSAANNAIDLASTVSPYFMIPSIYQGGRELSKIGAGQLAYNPQHRQQMQDMSSSPIGGALTGDAGLASQIMGQHKYEEDPGEYGHLLRESKLPKYAIGGDVVKAGANLAKKAAHEYANQAPGRMTDWLQHHPGKFIVPTQADRMGGVGGPSFSANSLALPKYKGFAWGSGNQPTASSITNLAKDERFGGPENQIFVPLLGHQNQHKSNQIVFNKLMEKFYENPEALTPELKAKIMDYMQSGGGIDPATNLPRFSPFGGFDPTDKGAMGLLGKSFENRGLIAQHVFGGQGIGKTKAQIFPYQKTLDEMADPTVAGAPTFAVGPRAFQLTGNVHETPRPDLNEAFPYLLEGRDLNVTNRPVENSAIFQDFQNQWRQHKGKTTPLKSGELPQPGYYENTLGYKVNPEDAERIYPRQEVTEQLLDSLYKKGHASGGPIESYAPGGKVLSAIKKMSEEAQAAYKAKFTPGFYHGSPSNKIKAFDPTKSNKPEEYITPGVTFLTQNPSFAHDYTPIRGTASKMVGQPDQYATGATIYPVSANLGKKFDFDTPEGKEIAKTFLKDKLIPNQGEQDAARWLAGMQDEHNTWKSLEHPDFLQHLKDTGHDSFAVKEAGINNVGIFDPKNIRGKFAKYNPEDAESTDFMKAEGGPVQHFVTGGRALSSGLEALQNLIKTEGRTPIVPMPNRWFLKPEDHPQLQGMVNKVLDKNQITRDQLNFGAFVDPRTGEILDRNIYNDVGVLIDPNTGKPMMSAGAQSGLDILDPKTGKYTASNLVRNSRFNRTGGDPLLNDIPFIATIEQGGMGHKYGLGTEYASPTEMYNTMKGTNPTLRPRSRGDVFGMGDVIGQIQANGKNGLTHDVYEKLFVAPKGSDVPGVKLSKAEGGEVDGYAPGGAIQGYANLGAVRKSLSQYIDPATKKIADWNWKPLPDVAQKLKVTSVPDYIQGGYGEFMKDQAARAANNQLTPRDLLKAYTITQSSIGRGGLPYTTATKAGLKLPNNGELVRPEGAFAEWLGSKEGQRYLDLAEKGEVDPAVLKNLSEKFAPFGKQNQLAGSMEYAANTIPGFSQDLNKAITGSKEDYRDWAEQLKGIAGAKSGFIGSMLGRGDLPTFDARQIGLHTGNEAPVSIGSIMSRGNGQGAREAVDRLSARQNALDLGIDPSLEPHYQHLTHHAVWDDIADSKTTHDDLVNAMKNYKKGGSI